MSTGRPPPWRDLRILRATAQVVFLVLVGWTAWYLATNLAINMRGANMRVGWGFLEQPAGFTIAGSDFRSTQPIWQALLAGLRNTVVVAVTGVVLATILGILVGVARLSTNWLVRKSAAAFVEAFRNIPLLVLLIFLYIAVLGRLPRPSDPIEWPGLVLSNRGLWTPWFEAHDGAGSFALVLLVGLALAVAVGWWRTRRFDATGQPHHRVLWGIGILSLVGLAGWIALAGPVTPTLPQRDGRIVTGGYSLSVEHGALLFGLVIYTAAFIAEIVRGSILSVPRGQTEAANAVGLNAFQRLRHVLLPQAMRVAIPPTGNEFLNLTKNTSLGIAIAFPELLRVTRIAIGNGQPAPQLMGLMTLTYLALSLLWAVFTNIVNRRLTGGA